MQNPPTPERVLGKSKLTLERKTLSLELRENARGQLLRITEHRDQVGRQDKIIIPATRETLEDLIGKLQEMKELLN